MTIIFEQCKNLDHRKAVIQNWAIVNKLLHTYKIFESFFFHTQCQKHIKHWKLTLLVYSKEALLENKFLLELRLE